MPTANPAPVFPRGRVLNTVADMRLVNGRTGEAVIMAGEDVAGDGGGGLFWWEQGVTTGDDGSTILVPTTSPTGRWRRLLSAGASNAIDVRTFGAKGDGVTDDTAAIAAARSAAIAQSKDLYFPAGVYLIAGELVHPGTFLGIRGDGPLTEIHFTGSGKGIVADAGAVSGNIFGISVRDLVVVGNDNVTHGVYCRGVHHSRVENVRVEDVTEDAFTSIFCVGTRFDNPLCSVNVRAFSIIPVCGIRLDARGSDKSSAVIINNPVLEGLGTANGIIIAGADMCRIDNGIVEGCLRALSITNGGGQHRISRLWMEANTFEDVLCDSFWCTFTDCLTNNTLAQGAALVSSTTTAVGVGTATDGAQTWTVDQWVGHTFTDSAGDTFAIIANTTTALALSPANTPAAGAYTIKLSAGLLHFGPNAYACVVRGGSWNSLRTESTKPHQLDGIDLYGGIIVDPGAAGFAPVLIWPRNLAQWVSPIGFTVGAETSDHIDVAVQFSVYGYTEVTIWISDVAQGTPTGTPPNGGTTFSTGTVLNGAGSSAVYFRVQTDVSGKVVLRLSETTAKSFYVNVALADSPSQAKVATFT